MTLPVHRWFRYSAGFPADWAESVIAEASKDGVVRVFDPFVGSGTTLLAAETVGAESWGVDSHPFLARVVQAKLAWRSDPEQYREEADAVSRFAQSLAADIGGYPSLIRDCYDDDALAELDTLRRAYEQLRDESSASALACLTLVGILRRASRANAAQWQYVLPGKQKRSPIPPQRAWSDFRQMLLQDMALASAVPGPGGVFTQTDARTCDGVPTGWANLVVTSPPYPNNYDYADATRLEMSFLGEIGGWGQLQTAVRRHLIRSCSQHVTERSVDLDAVLDEPDLAPIKAELSDVCHTLAEVRKTRGGKKTYHLMVACYFRDLAQVWKSLRRVCSSPSRVCFVIGDSARYGVYVPVVPWLAKLALAAGFERFFFERTRDRNVTWKNRKHRVPLQEGWLWVQG
jgi:hypothetical protein